MRIFTTIIVIGVIVLIADGENSNVTRRKKVAGTAMEFESRHLSIQQCDSMNSMVGRGMKWNHSNRAFIDTIAATETIKAAVGVYQAPAAEKTPAWVSEIQQKGEAYQAEKKQKTNRNRDRLSTYSTTELSIAKNMGLNPWEIDREQLRTWGRETDTILSKL